MAIAYVASAKQEYGARTSLELTKPGEAGDWIGIYPYDENGSSKVHTVKQGEAACTSIAPQLYSAANLGQGAYWCIHDGTSSKIKVTWEGNASVGSVLILDAWRGVHPTEPIDVAQATFTVVTAASFKCPSLETKHANAMEIEVWVSNTGTGPKETPAGWTLRTQYSPHTYSRLREAVGATGETEFKAVESNKMAHLHFALRPAAKVVELSGSVTSSSLLSGKLAALRGLKGTIAAASLLSGPLRALRSLKGTLAAGSQLSGSLDVSSLPTTDRPNLGMRVREYPRTDLHYEIETPNGRFYRWAKDEPRPENVPSGGGHASTAPGGFDTNSVTLPRKPGVDYSDLERLSSVRALGAGGELACETRLKEAPRVSGEKMSVGPVTEGWIAHLQDDTTAAEIYRDVDLSSWIGPGRARLLELEGANLPANGGFEVLTDATTGLPALRLHVDGHWETVIPCAEVWYDAGPSARVARVYYDYSGNGNTLFVLEFGYGPTDTGVGLTGSGDIYGVAAAAGTATPASPQRFFLWNWRYNATPAGGDGQTFNIDLRRLAVEGAHGLTKYGAEPVAGFLASDIVADAISRWAPALAFSVGSAGTIRPTSTLIPHLVFKEKTTALAILEGANAFEGRLYGVWDDRTFHYYNWGDRGRKWRARVGPTELTETGPTTERLRNGVIVSFRDAEGTTKTAGPIGSGCDFESALLEDRDPENPANKRGLKMYGPPIDIGQSTSYAGAEIPIGVGHRILEVLKETDRSGTMKIVGYCEDDRGVIHPAWAVRAGDVITPVDASEPVERRIIRAEYDEASLTNTLTLDAPAQGVPELVAQLGVSAADLAL